MRISGGIAGWAIAAAVAVGTAAMPAAAKVVIKAGTEVNEKHPVGAGMQWFAKRVDELSKGDIEVKLFLGESLGKAREMVEGLQLGTIDYVTVTAGIVANFAPSHDFFSLPFLWDDGAHLQRVMDGPLSEDLAKSLDEVDIVALGYGTSGARQLYSSKTIGGLDDIKGMKVRTMEVPQIVETWKALGAIPVPVAFAEVYQALQTGVVDGAESSFLGWISMKHYEPAPKGYRINYINSGRAYMLSKSKAQQIGPERVAILRQATQELIKRVADEYERQDNEAAEKAKTVNAEVIVLDTKPFREAVKPVYEKFKPSLGPKVFERVEAARQP